MTSNGPEFLATVPSRLVPVGYVPDVGPIEAVRESGEFPRNMSPYAVKCAWRFGGYYDDRYPGPVLALLRMYSGIVRFDDLAELGGIFGGDSWRYLGGLPFAPLVVIPPVPTPAPWAATEPAHRAAGARALHDRTARRCAPLRGPNHARTRFPRAGADMSG